MRLQGENRCTSLKPLLLYEAFNCDLVYEGVLRACAWKESRPADFELECFRVGERDGRVAVISAVELFKRLRVRTQPKRQDLCNTCNTTRQSTVAPATHHTSPYATSV